MSLYELPENLIKAIVDEGMKTAWKESLGLKSEAARRRAKEIIYQQAKTKRGRSFPEKGAIAARMFLEVGPLLAENEAITRAVAKHPMLRNAAPEILTRQEAVELALQEYPFMDLATQSLLELLLRDMQEAKKPPMMLPKD